MPRGFHRAASAFYEGLGRIYGAGGGALAEGPVGVKSPSLSGVDRQSERKRTGNASRPVRLNAFAFAGGLCYDTFDFSAAQACVSQSKESGEGASW